MGFTPAYDNQGFYAMSYAPESLRITYWTIDELVREETGTMVVEYRTAASEGMKNDC